MIKNVLDLKPGDLRSWVYPSKRIGEVFLVLSVNSFGVSVLMMDGRISEGWNFKTLSKWSVLVLRS